MAYRARMEREGDGRYVWLVLISYPGEDKSDPVVAFADYKDAEEWIRRAEEAEQHHWGYRRVLVDVVKRSDPIPDVAATLAAMP